MNIEENPESIQKEILQHKIKVMGKDWVQNRLEAKEQVKNMKKHLNSLSEEEAHRQAVEQAEKIKRLREERMSRGEDSFSRRRFKKIQKKKKDKAVLDRYSKQFYFWNPSKKSDTFAVQITEWETIYF